MGGGGGDFPERGHAPCGQLDTDDAVVGDDLTQTQLNMDLPLENHNYNYNYIAIPVQINSRI